MIFAPVSPVHAPSFVFLRPQLTHFRSIRKVLGVSEIMVYCSGGRGEVPLGQERVFRIGV
jgi:hypothetical protein